MPEGGDAGRVLTIEDLIAALDRYERTPSNVPKVETFLFDGERVLDWLDLVEQAMVGLSDEVKFQRVMRYVLHRHHQEVEKVVDAAHGSWARFKENMLRKYRLGDGLLTIQDLEGMNKDDFTTIGAFVQEFKKKARKVHGISEERQCAIFLGLLTVSEAAELMSHGAGSAKLTWATIDRGVEDGSLDQVEKHQMRLQRRKRKERDATASGTPGVKRIITDVLAALGYGQDTEAQRKAVAVVQGRGKEVGDEGARQEDYGGEETGLVWQEEEAKGKEDRAMVVGDKEAEGVADEAEMEEDVAADGTTKGARAKETKVQEEEEEDDDTEDERLRQEEDRREEQRAQKKEAHERAEPGLQDGVPRKRKYTVRLEEDFDVERMVDRLLEGHNDLMNLKDILASAPRLREELKGRLSRRLVPNVHLSVILPRELGWTQAGTRMDWKCAPCRLVDLVIKEKKCVAIMDTGAEMNIIRKRDALMLGMEIDRADHGVLHGANCKAIFCGTALNVIIEIGKVLARTSFFVMPDVDHPILLGKSFMCRTETLIFNKHDEMMILLLSDPDCGNYEVVTCRNTGPGSERNRSNPGSFTYVESENERRRLAEESEEEGGAEVLSLSLTDVSKAMEIVAAHEMADPEAIKALREHVLECPQAGEVELIYRLPGGRKGGRLKQGAQRQYKTVDKKCRPVPVLVTEDEKAYYERERGLIRWMQEQALRDPCRINDGNEGELIVGEPGFLSPQERMLMLQLMKKRHRAYAFNDDQRGRLDVDKILMIRIHTVPHKPWNLRGARYPNPDEEKMVVDSLDGKMRTHIAGYSSGPYASPWFCFIKPNGTLRWVQDLQRLNAVTVRDARGLPNADALSESCAGRPIISLIDLYSGYDQFPVYPPDRPVTAMHTSTGLIHMNVVPQGWTNAVAMVQRHMIRVMQTVSPHITQPYINDLAVKGPKEREEDEVQPGVRRFVWRHILDLDLVLGLLEEHNLTASGPKSKHCMREATILGFVCNEKGRKPDVKKTDKILGWSVPF
ncbi:hypothetical protein CBR_g45639 [Chara braunii]|uniref:Reverse transcriptase domain-containing protein n=1 Tax=Chara braunii TaxID=69332 RepID=A0A388K3E9_CHABU|nr:hypothetical protein CBR_g45639 [Chara braunii]|eukprot:GBG64582.1 hypothetical protein CBR_g45639 [Chara braunii]